LPIRSRSLHANVIDLNPNPTSLRQNLPVQAIDNELRQLARDLQLLNDFIRNLHPRVAAPPVEMPRAERRRMATELRRALRDRDRLRGEFEKLQADKEDVLAYLMPMQAANGRMKMLPTWSVLPDEAVYNATKQVTCCLLSRAPSL
jgi:hypothetical protein